MARRPQDDSESPPPDLEAADGVRLARYLAMAGIGSRRHCEEFITGGRVTVDKLTVVDLAARVDPSRETVRLDGEKVTVERRVYFLVNKPKGLLCTNHDPDGRPKVVDLFPKMKQRLFTVGRLDEHSQGLIVVTNDGDLAQRLAHPRYRVTKTYRVQVAGIPSPAVIRQLERGFYFAEGKFKADAAKLVKTKGQSAWIEIVLSEGQNREIRRLLARVGHKVLVLERVALGALRLGPMPVGAFRPLTPIEVKSLYALATRNRTVAEKGSASGPSKSTGGARPPRKSAQKLVRPGQPASLSPTPDLPADAGAGSGPKPRRPASQSAELEGDRPAPRSRATAPPAAGARGPKRRPTTEGKPRAPRKPKQS
jgi:23S rRNA pseudouridine2605 synthase